MKKLALLILLFISIQNISFADTVVFNEEGLFGIKDDSGHVLVMPKYRKLVRLGEKGWIAQKGSKFGIISDTGEERVAFKYNRAERILGRYAKFTKGSKCGIFDEQGFDVIPFEYTTIDILYGGMFLTYKNYKYGLADINGQVIVDNLFDDIYMPKPNVMMLVYNGRKYEILGVGENSEELTLPVDMASISDNQNFKITELIQKPGTTTGYYSVTATNYFLKIFSSISTAYEETIDELMFLQGADAAGTIINFSWIPKFPVIYIKKYCSHLVAPNNGPLQEVKTNLKQQLKD